MSELANLIVIGSLYLSLAFKSNKSWALFFQTEVLILLGFMNALSRREEETLLKTTKERALRECDLVVQEFAACAAGRTISVAWACKDKLKAVQDCMVQFTGPEPMEKVRKEYLRLRNQQREERQQQGPTNSLA